MREHHRFIITVLGFVLLAVASAACSDEGLDSDEEARRAYLGLDESIGKSLQLGFDGFNAASSANIDPQMTAGDDTGTLTITGQVDQGSSDNKGMRLYVGMVDYSEGLITVTYEDEEVDVDLTYDTSDVQVEQPYLMLQLRNFPSGTLYGELTGDYNLHGDIEGTVTLDLVMNGVTIDAGNGDVMREVGTTVITGTATSGDGHYDVNLTI